MAGEMGAFFTLFVILVASGFEMVAVVGSTLDMEVVNTF